jgi:hypothetical protein
MKEEIKDLVKNAVNTKLNESSLSRIAHHIQNHQCGVISGFRYASHCGEGSRLTRSENMNRNAQIRAVLLNKGYGVTPVKGSYIENYGSDKEIEVQEESLFVIDLQDSGKLLQDLKVLGKKFEQDSIAHMTEAGEWTLHGTNDCPNAYPGFGRKVRLGTTRYGKVGEFFSRVRGRPFIFESIGENVATLTELSMSEIRSVKGFVKLYETEQAD